MPLDVIQQLRDELGNLDNQNQQKLISDLKDILGKADEYSLNEGVLRDILNSYQSEEIGKNLKEIVDIFKEFTSAEKIVKDFIKTSSDLEKKIKALGDTNDLSSLSKEFDNLNKNIERTQNVLSSLHIKDGLFRSVKEEGEEFTKTLKNIQTGVSDIGNGTNVSNSQLKNFSDNLKNISSLSEKLQRINLGESLGGKSIGQAFNSMIAKNSVTVYKNNAMLKEAGIDKMQKKAGETESQFSSRKYDRLSNSLKENFGLEASDNLNNLRQKIEKEEYKKEKIERFKEMRKKGMSISEINNQFNDVKKESLQKAQDKSVVRSVVETQKAYKEVANIAQSQIDKSKRDLGEYNALSQMDKERLREYSKNHNLEDTTARAKKFYKEQQEANDKGIDDYINSRTGIGSKNIKKQLNFEKNILSEARAKGVDTSKSEEYIRKAIESGRFNDKTMSNAIKMLSKTDSGKIFMKSSGLNEYLPKGAGGQSVRTYGVLLKEAASSLHSAATKLNDVATKFANIRVAMSRLDKSGADVFGGSIRNYQEKFGLTRQQTMEVAPRIESFLRNSNADMSVVNKISENLKNANGVLRPEDLTNALQALQGMTKGQINSITGTGPFNISDSIGASFSLMESPEQLDRMIKVMSSGAFSGEAGVEDNDKALLEANQKMNVLMEDLNNKVSEIVSMFGPIMPFLSKGLGMVLQAIGAIATVKGVASSLGMLGDLPIGKGKFKALGRLARMGKFGKVGSGVAKVGSGIANVGSKIAGVGMAGAGATLAGIATAGLAAYGVTKLTADYFHNRGQNKIRKEMSQTASEYTKSRQKMLLLERERKHKKALGWKGAASGAAAGAVTGAAIGSAVIPIPVVGAIIGAAIGGLVGAGTAYLASKNSDTEKEKSLKKQIEDNKKIEETLKKINNEHLNSLKALKTYQTLIKQIRSGAFTKFEDNMVKTAENNLNYMSIAGGTSEGFESAKESLAQFSTLSFNKNMEQINRAMENVNKGEDADGSGKKLRPEEKIVAYNSLLNQQIDITKKWIESIEKSIGQYDKIPTVILNNMKAKIDQFQFEVSRMGVGSSSNQLNATGKGIQRAGESLGEMMKSFFGDSERALKATEDYKKANVKKYNMLASTLNSLGVEVDGVTNASEIGGRKQDREIVSNAREKAHDDINRVLGSDKYKSLELNSNELMQFESSIELNKINAVNAKEKEVNEAIEHLKSIFDVNDIEDLRYKGVKKEELDELTTSINEGKHKETIDLIRSLADIKIGPLAKKMDAYKIVKNDLLKDVEKQFSIAKSSQQFLGVDDGSLVEARNKAKPREELLKNAKEEGNKIKAAIEASMNTADISTQEQFYRQKEAGFYGQQMSGNAADSINKMFTSSMYKYNAQNANLEKTKNDIRTMISNSFEENQKSLKKMKLGEDKTAVLEYSKLMKEMQQMRLAGDEAGVMEKMRELDKTRSTISDPKALAALEAIDVTNGVVAEQISNFKASQEKIESERRRTFDTILTRMKDIDTNTSKMYLSLAKAQESSVKFLGRTTGNRSAINSEEGTYYQNITKGWDDKIAQAQKYQKQSVEEIYNEIRSKEKGISNEDAMQKAIEYKSTAIDVENEAKLGKQSALEQGFKAMIEAKNILLDLKDESINYQKDFANLVGAPIGTILALEQESVRTQQERFQNAKESYEKLFKSGADTATLQKAANAVAKEQLSLAQKTVGLQRGFIEKMFGRLLGQFKSSVGFAGASLGSKYGAGYSTNAAGTVVGTGIENKKGNKTYAERVMKNQMSALGDTSIVGDNLLEKGNKPSQTVNKISQYTNDTAKTTKTISEDVKKIAEHLKNGKSTGTPQNPKDKASNDGKYTSSKEQTSKEQTLKERDNKVKSKVQNEFNFDNRLAQEGVSKDDIFRMAKMQKTSPEEVQKTMLKQLKEEERDKFNRKLSRVGISYEDVKKLADEKNISLEEAEKIVSERIDYVEKQKMKQMRGGKIKKGIIPSEKQMEEMAKRGEEFEKKKSSKERVLLSANNVIDNRKETEEAIINEAIQNAGIEEQVANEAEIVNGLYAAELDELFLEKEEREAKAKKEKEEKEKRDKSVRRVGTGFQMLKNFMGEIAKNKIEVDFTNEESFDKTVASLQETEDLKNIGNFFSKFTPEERELFNKMAGGNKLKSSSKEVEYDNSAFVDKRSGVPSTQTITVSDFTEFSRAVDNGLNFAKKAQNVDEIAKSASKATPNVPIKVNEVDKNKKGTVSQSKVNEQSSNATTGYSQKDISSLVEAVTKLANAKVEITFKDKKMEEWFVVEMKKFAPQAISDAARGK